jgi:hypothetical protein
MTDETRKALSADTIAAWRLCLDHDPQPQLGEFNWPMVLEKALDALDAAEQENARLREFLTVHGIVQMEAERDAAVARLATVEALCWPCDVNPEYKSLTVARVRAALAAAVPGGAEKPPETASKVEAMCHWRVDPDSPHDPTEQHMAFHFGRWPGQSGVCPYFAAAEVLRGRLDPRPVSAGGAEKAGDQQ